MFIHTLSFMNLINSNKRIAIALITVLLLAVVVLALTPGIAQAGMATSPSACGTCAG